MKWSKIAIPDDYQLDGILELEEFVNLESPQEKPVDKKVNNKSKKNNKHEKNSKTPNLISKTENANINNCNNNDENDTGKSSFVFKNTCLEKDSQNKTRRKRLRKSNKSEEHKTIQLNAKPLDPTKQPEFADKNVLNDENKQDQTTITTDYINQWFEIGIKSKLAHVLYRLGFRSPTLVQKNAIFKCLNNKKSDFIVAAETGSGKTLAFLIPIINWIYQIHTSWAFSNNPDYSLDEPISNNNNNDNNQNGLDDSNIDLIKEPKNMTKKLRALILTPTRELALQIDQQVKKFTSTNEYGDIKSMSIIGGLSVMKQQRLLGYQPEIIIATPGRLWSLLQDSSSLNENCYKYLSDFSGLKVLVIDEVDRIVEAGHFAEAKLICQMVRQNAQVSLRTWVYSATASLNLDENQTNSKKITANNKNITTSNTKSKTVNLSRMLVDKIGLSKDAIMVDLTNRFVTPTTLQEYRVLADEDEKVLYLYFFLKQNPGKTIIFVNTIKALKKLAKIIKMLNFESAQLHAGRQQKLRLKCIESFIEGKYSILLATDVAARGLDIPSVDNVIHFHVPHHPDSYVHRSGRTARYFKPGQSVLFISPSELTKYTTLLKVLNREQVFDNQHDIPKYDCTAALAADQKISTRIKNILKYAEIELQLEYIQQESNWFKKKEKMTEIIPDPDFCTPIASNQSHQIQSLRSQLSKLRPLIK